MKRWLHLAHRWMGIVLCLFMAMWFFSGAVMMYVGYPKLTTAERLAALPELPPDALRVTPGEALAALGRSAPPEELRLTSIGTQPHYVMMFGRGELAAVDASSGKPVTAPVGAEAAAASARAFARRPVSSLGIVDEDAWTHSRALDAHRPLHLVTTDDGTWYYVSSRTGEVVRDATRVERVWNWVGAWIHWLYPLRGGWLDRWWAEIIVYSSLFGTLLAISGVVVGVMRWRFGTAAFKSGSRSPYREAMPRWHHIGGLAFGVLAATWAFSGMMSVNPWKLFDAHAAKLDMGAWRGVRLEGTALPAPADALRRFGQAGLAARELEWRAFDGQAIVVGRDASGATRVVEGAGGRAHAAHGASDGVAPERLLAAGARLLPGARVVEAVWLDAYDAYYYVRAPHTMGGHLDKRLPVLRLKFDDAHATWVHLDPRTGSVINRLDERQRVKRWLFAFLHSFDWLPLLDRRPLWDVLLLAASAGGLAISVTGVVMAARRLRRKSGPDGARRGAPSVGAARPLA